MSSVLTYDAHLFVLLSLRKLLINIIKPSAVYILVAAFAHATLKQLCFVCKFKNVKNNRFFVIVRRGVVAFHLAGRETFGKLHSSVVYSARPSYQFAVSIYVLVFA